MTHHHTLAEVNSAEDVPVSVGSVMIAHRVLETPMTPHALTDAYWLSHKGMARLNPPDLAAGYSYPQAATNLLDLLQAPELAPDATASFFGIALRSAVHVVDRADVELHIRRQRIGGSVPAPHDMPGATPTEMAHIYVVGHPPVQAFLVQGHDTPIITAIAPDSEDHTRARAITDAMHAHGSRNPAHDDPTI